MTFGKGFVEANWKLENNMIIMPWVLKYSYLGIYFAESGAVYQLHSVSNKDINLSAQRLVFLASG